MKTLIAVLVLSVPVIACKPNEIPWEGRCAADPKPLIDLSMDELAAKTAKETDQELEKPPRHPEPAWERGDVKADTPPSCAYTNNCSDQEAIDAAAEGRRKAGIR